MYSFLGVKRGACPPFLIRDIEWIRQVNDVMRIDNAAAGQEREREKEKERREGEWERSSKQSVFDFRW